MNRKQKQDIVLFTIVLFTLLIFSTTIIGAEVTEEWIMFRENLNHTGYTKNAAVANISDASVETFTTSIAVTGSAAVANGYVYIGSWDDKLYQLNASNISTKIAEFTTDSNIESSPAVANGYVYVGSNDGQVYQLNASNISQEIANFTTLGAMPEVEAEPTVTDKYVYVGTTWHNYFYQLNASNVSRLIEIYYPSGTVAGSAAVANGYVYFGDNANWTYQLNASNISQEIAKFNTLAHTPSPDGDWVMSSPAIADGYVYVGTYGTQGKVYQLNASNISQEIAYKLIGEFIRASPAVANGYVYVADYDGKVYQLNASNISQNIIATYDNGWGMLGAFESSPTVTDKYVYIGSNNGLLYQLNASNVSREIATYNVGDDVRSEVSIANGYIYFGSTDDNVYQIGEGGAQTITCVSCPSCNVAIQAASPGDTVMLTDNISDQSGTCIDFNGQDNVTFDCDGNIIDGDDSGSDYGIYLPNIGDGTNYNTVKNCQIRDFNRGVYIAGFTNTYASYNNLININSTSNAGAGATGIYLYCSNHTSIKNITSTYNYNGFYLDYTDNTLLENIAANNNDNRGISLHIADSNDFINAEVNYNDDDGFDLYDSDSNNFTDCILNLNTYFGFDLYYSDFNIFTNVTVLDSIYDYCFKISDSNSNIIRDSKIENDQVFSQGGIILSNAGSSGANKIYNCLLNNSYSNVVFSGNTYSNEWNTTIQTGPNIIGGPDIGGNYWTRPSGTGFSDNCSDSNGNGFCDQIYDVGLDDPGCTSNNCDRLPLSAGPTSLCGMWINEDTTLDENITGCTDTVIYINASDITLDCDGHYLESSAHSFSGNRHAGINISGFDNVTIKNCIINMSNNSYGDNGIFLDSNSDGNNITNNIIYVGDDYGIHLENIQLGPSSCDNNTISENTIIASSGGIYLHQVNKNRVYNNNITVSSMNGIWLENSSFNNISYNNVSSNMYGIYLEIDNCNYNKLVENNVIATTTNAIFLWDGSYNEIIGGNYISNGIDYSLSNVGTTNTFRNTNLTGARQIYIDDSTSGFNYNNDSTGGIWLKTAQSGGGGATITRRLTSWTQDLVRWNDTSTASISAYHNLTDLTDGEDYRVYDNGGLIHTLTATGGKINFSVSLLGDHNISVEKDSGLPEASNDSCGLVTASLKLIADVTSPGTCFNISTSDIFIDCDGYTITYATSADGNGILVYSDASNDAYDNITIKNCRIISGPEGEPAIAIRGKESSDVGGAVNITITNNHINVNDGDFDNSDFSTNPAAIHSVTNLGCNNDNISNNTIIALGGSKEGIYYYYPVNVTISNNIINSSGDSISLEDSHNFIHSNKVYSQSRRGIFLRWRCDDIDIYNNIINSERSTIYSEQDLNKSKIFDNNLTTIGSYPAIYLSSGYLNEIYNNIINATNGYAIEINNNSYAYKCDNNSIYNNLFNSDNYLLTNLSCDNYWNTTNQTGTRIYGSGTNIGGNAWINGSGTGYYYDCVDSDTDGFCDFAYDIENDVPNNDCSGSNNCDYLPLSDEYIGNSPPNQPTLNDPFPSGVTGQPLDVLLNVTVTDPDGDGMASTFYDASDDSIICDRESGNYWVSSQSDLQRDSYCYFQYCSYALFDISDIFGNTSEDIAKAHIRAYVTQLGETNTIAVWEVENTTWQEGHSCAGLNSQPLNTTSKEVSAPVCDSTGWCDIDITQTLKTALDGGHTLLSLRLHGEDSTTCGSTLGSAQAWRVAADSCNVGSCGKFFNDRTSGTYYPRINVTFVAPDSSDVTCNWFNLFQLTTYDWYVNVSDAQYTTQSSTWSFTTQAIDATKPDITWVEPPTPGDGTDFYRNWVTLEATVTDTHNTSAWFDWNDSLIGYWSMDYYNSTHVYDNSSNNNHGLVLYTNLTGFADENSDENQCREYYYLSCNNDTFIGWYFMATSGTGNGQIRTISDYYVPSQCIGQKILYFNSSISGFKQGDSYILWYDTEGPEIVYSKYSKGLDFDGVNDYVNVGNSSDFNITDEITIEAWVKRKELKYYGRIVDRQRTRNYALRMNFDGRIEFAFKVDGGGLIGNSNWSDFGIPKYEWGHVAATYNGNITHYYINGQYAGNATSENFGPIDANNSYNLCIGSESDLYYGCWFYQFNGSIDEVKIHDRVLTHEEINASYNNKAFQLRGNMTNLPYFRTYDYNAYAIDEYGNLRITPYRSVTTIPCYIDSQVTLNSDLDCPNDLNITSTGDLNTANFKVKVGRYINLYGNMTVGSSEVNVTNGTSVYSGGIFNGGSGLHDQGSIFIDANVNYTATSGITTMNGNVTNNGNFLHNNGAFVFVENATVYMESTANSFYNLTILDGVKLTTKDNINVRGSYNIDGILAEGIPEGTIYYTGSNVDWLFFGPNGRFEGSVILAPENSVNINLPEITAARNLYHLFINFGTDRNVTMMGNVYVVEDLRISAGGGAYHRGLDTNGYNLTVIDDVDIGTVANGTLYLKDGIHNLGEVIIRENGTIEGGYSNVTFSSLNISFGGRYEATSDKTILKGNFSNDGNLNHNTGAFVVVENATFYPYSTAGNKMFYNLTVVNGKKLSISGTSIAVVGNYHINGTFANADSPSTRNFYYSGSNANWLFFGPNGKFEGIHRLTPDVAINLYLPEITQTRGLSTIQLICGAGTKSNLTMTGNVYIENWLLISDYTPCNEKSRGFDTNGYNLTVDGEVFAGQNISLDLGPKENGTLYFRGGTHRINGDISLNENGTIYMYDNATIISSGNLTNLWSDDLGEFHIFNGSVINLTVNSTKYSVINSEDIALHYVSSNPDTGNYVGINKFVNITNLTASATTDLEIYYNDSDLGGVDELDLSIYRYDGSNWNILPSVVNAAENKISTSGINSFSVFGVLGATDDAKPDIMWVDPTPYDGETVDQEWVYLNATVTDASNTSAFFDWNYSLRGYWSFDYVDNMYVYDNSTYKNNCTYVGGLSDSNITTGKYGNALHFNNETSDYLTCGNDLSLNITNEITIEAWIKPNNAHNGAILDRFDGGVPGNGYLLDIRNTGDIALEIRTFDEDRIRLTAPGVYSTGVWQHVVAIYDGRYTKIYLDGTELINHDFGSEKDIYCPDTETLNIGGGVLDWYFNGSIDEVRVHSRALTPEEINASYNNYAYELKGNITNLAERDYNYRAYAMDEHGNLRITGMRSVSTINIDLINVTTSSLSYSFGELVTFTSYFTDSSGNSVRLLVDDDPSFANCNYNTQTGCIASSNTLAATGSVQQLTTAIIANDDTTWYAKVCNDKDNCDEMSNHHFWEDGDNWNITFNSNGSDSINSIDIDSEGNIYVAGHGYDLISGSSDRDLWIMKLDENGTELWNYSFDGRGGSDSLYEVTVDGYGNIYTVGTGDHLLSTFSDWDWWIKKFDSDGNEDTTNWNLTFGGNNEDEATTVVTDSNGNVYVAGHEEIGTNKNLWIKKFDSDGNEIWDTTFDGNGGLDRIGGIRIDPENYIYMAGHGEHIVSPTSEDDYWTMKINSTDGNDIWNATFDNSSGSEKSYSIAIDSNNDLYVTGGNWWLKKYDSDGNEDSNWDVEPVNNFSTKKAMYVGIDSKDNVYITGYANNIVSSDSNRDWWIRKFDTDRNEDSNWNLTFHGGVSGGDDRSYYIAFDSKDNVYIVGYRTVPTTGADWWIKKFDYTAKGSFLVTDTTKPDILWIPPTPYYGETIPLNEVYLNTTIIDASNTSAFFDWNDSLVGYWSMDYVNEGYVLDNSSYSNDGNRYGGIPLSGKYGEGMDFDGDNDYISVDSSDAFKTLEFTVSVWVYPKELGSDDGYEKYMIVRAENSTLATNKHFMLSINNETDRLRFILWSTTGVQACSVSSSNTVQKNQWNFIVGGFNGTHCFVSLDNDMNYVANTSSINYLADKNLTIGRRWGNSAPYAGYFNGTIDEVRIHKRVLSPEEINASYNNKAFRLKGNITDLKYNKEYYYRAYAIDEYGNLRIAENRLLYTDPVLRLINVLTDSLVYSPSTTVTFTANINGSPDQNIILVIDDDPSFTNCNYNTQTGCINSSSTLDTTGSIQQMNAVMTASTDLTWYAQICNSEGECDNSYFNNNFTRQNITTDQQDNGKIYPVDLDFDGDIDIVTVADGVNRWYENDGSGGFTSHDIHSDDEPSMGLAVADLDGDYDLDIIVSNRVAGNHGTGRWYENDGSQSFTSHEIFNNTLNIWQSYSADLDGDTDIDIVVFTYGDEERWYENNGSGNFTAHIVAPVGTNCFSGNIVDLDKDGDIDILAGISGPNNRWYENNGSGNFTAYIISPNSQITKDIPAADLDKDGDIDILSANWLNSAPGVRNTWYENDGAQNFVQHNITSYLSTTHAMSVVDLDDDGDIDVLTGNDDLAVNRWYENNGSANFTGHNITNDGYYTLGISSADIDNDEDMDIVIANGDAMGNEINRWYENVEAIFSGNFTVGDECGVLNGGITLRTDVSSPGTCFIINSSDLVLDCDGYTINYSYSYSGFAVNVTNFDNITVKNCRIIQDNNSVADASGINFNSSSNGNITNNSIFVNSSGNSYGIWLHNTSDNNTVSYNNATSTGNLGAGIHLQNTARYNNITNNIVNNNVYLGMALCGGAQYNLLVNNTGLNNIMQDFHCDWCRNNIIIGDSYDGQNSDFWFHEAGASNYFQGVNFSTPRKIYLTGDDGSTFRFSNETTGDIWLDTTVASFPAVGAAVINRDLLNWNKSLIEWNESDVWANTPTITYTLRSLYNDSYYYIYNNSNKIYSLKTDANGNLPSFNISLTAVYSTQHQNIQVVYYNDTYKPNITWIEPPTPGDGSTVIVDNVYLNATVEDASNTSAFFDWSNSLVGYWSMDFADASYVYDNSSYRNNCTYAGGLSVNDITIGKYGDGLDFNGAGNYLNCGNDNSLDATDGLTVEAWVYLKRKTIDYPVIAIKSNTYGLRYDNNTNRPYFFFWNSTPLYNYLEFSSALSLNEWHHLVATYDGSSGEAKVYFDGSLDNSKTVLPASIRVTTNPVTIGGIAPIAHFNGSIDEVKIHTRILSPEEINASYNNKIYQLEGNITNLPDGDHDYNAYAIDEYGNLRITPYRSVTVQTDTTKPIINWVEPPTPPDGGIIEVDRVELEATVTDDTNTSAWFDWSNSLVGYWSMDFADSNYVYDNSSYDNHGTYQGTLSQSDIVSGKYGDVMEFEGNGSDDNINISDDSAFDFGFDSFTIEMWFKLKNDFDSSSSAVMPLLSTYEENNHNMYLTLWGTDGSKGDPLDGSIVFKQEGGGPPGVYSNTSRTFWSADTWYHIVVIRRDNDSVDFYVNGELDISLSNKLARNISLIDGSLQIGGGPIDDGTGGPEYRYFNGTIDEVKLHHRALTPEEINASYNNNIFLLTGNITNITDGHYTYRAYAIDEQGNLRITSYRDVTVMSKPNITWVDPTPTPGEIINVDNAYLNATVYDTSNTSAWIDWNSSLKGYWSMDFADASYVYDNSSYDNHGTYIGGLSIDNITTGKYGDALEFDGTNDYLFIDHDDDLNITSEITVESWLYAPSSATGWRSWIGRYENETNGSWFCEMNNFDLTFYIISGGARRGVAATLPQDEWVHFVFTYDGAVLNLYFNGSLVNTANYEGGEIDIGDNLPITIGRDQRYSQYWLGYIDEVKIHDRALSHKEINASYNNKRFRLENNFTFLDVANYTYRAYAIDELGNLRISSHRNFTVDIDDEAPNITWIEPPTPLEGDTVYVDNVYLNATVYDTSNTSAFFDWDDTLAAYWSMDYLDAVYVYDNSSYRNNATYKGGTSQNSVVAGVYGHALEFDGFDDELIVYDPGDSSLDINDKISISAWVYDYGGGTISFDINGAPSEVGVDTTEDGRTVKHANTTMSAGYMGTWNITGDENVQRAYSWTYPSQLNLHKMPATNQRVFTAEIWDKDQNILIDNETYWSDYWSDRPIIGNNWTRTSVVIAPTTNATNPGNLTIFPISGTTWSDSNDSEELRFLGVKCGSSGSFETYTWLANNTVVVEDYYCNISTYIISKVHASGEHYLRTRHNGSYIRDHSMSTWVSGYIVEDGGSCLANFKVGKNYSYKIYYHGNANISIDNFFIDRSHQRVIHKPSAYRIYSGGGSTGSMYINWLVYFSDGTYRSRTHYLGTGNYRKWHHIVTTYEKGGNMSIYVNGILEDNIPATKAIRVTDYDVIIGEHNAIRLDELAVYNRILSLGEIKAIYNNTVNRLENNLTDLVDGLYEYKAYAIDDYGNLAITGIRNVTVEVDPTEPNITWEPPTPLPGETVSVDSVYLNTTINDSSNTSASFDWNYSLRGYWSMDYVDVNYVYDNSSYGHHANMSSNGTTIEDVTKYGKRGMALDFDGVDDYIALPTNNMTAGRSEFTIEFWINPDEWVSSNTIWDEYYSNTRWQNSIRSDYWYTRDISLASPTDPREDNDVRLPSLTPAEWHHLAFVYSVNQSIKAIYWNGELFRYTNFSIDAMNTYRQGARIGYPCDGYYFDGKLDEIKLHDRVLSLEEINASYNNKVFRLRHNFTDLADGNYTYKAYAIDESGNLEITDIRNVTVEKSLCGMYIDETTNLTQDITNCTGTIIYINASDITLDCSGHLLEGDMLGAITTDNSGVSNSDWDNVTVKNCNIQINGSTGMAGIYYYYSDNGTIKNNTINARSVDTDIDHYGIYVYGSKNDSILNNKINGSEKPIMLEGSQHNFVFDNNISYCKQDAITLLGSDNNTVAYNYINNSEVDGLYIVAASFYNNISNNIIRYAGHGLCIHSDYNEFYDNYIYESYTGGCPSGGCRGLNIHSSNNLFRNTTVVDMSHDGIFIGSNEENNTIIDGSVSGSGDWDYYLASNTSSNTFKNTNFSDMRKIHLHENDTAFNYSNVTPGAVWLSTRIADAGGGDMDRNSLSYWNQSIVQWNDSVSSAVNVQYNLSNLTDGEDYRIYVDTVFQNTVTATDGVIDISVTLTSDHNISVEYVGNLPPIIILNDPSPSGITDQPLDVILNVTVIDPNDDDMNVSFWDEDTGLQIDSTQFDVANGSDVTVTWSNLLPGVTYHWYARADDGLVITQSDVWNFTTTRDIDRCTRITTSGEFYLSVDINDSPIAPCINISAKDVYLNCQEYWIDGDEIDDVNDYGIYAYRSVIEDSNITLISCFVSNWTDANIYFANSNNNTVNKITSVFSDTGIYLFNSDNNEIYTSKFTNNDYGMQIDTSAYNLIYDNLFNNTANANFIGVENRNNWSAPLAVADTITKRIYGKGTAGGNAWMTGTGVGYYYECEDADRNGICDIEYDVYNDQEICASQNCDMLPLSSALRSKGPITYRITFRSRLLNIFRSVL